MADRCFRKIVAGQDSETGDSNIAAMPIDERSGWISQFKEPAFRCVIMRNKISGSMV